MEGQQVVVQGRQVIERMESVPAETRVHTTPNHADGIHKKVKIMMPENVRQTLQNPLLTFPVDSFRIITFPAVSQLIPLSLSPTLLNTPVPEDEEAVAVL